MLFLLIIYFTGCTSTVSQRRTRTIVYPNGGICKVSKTYLLNSIEFVSLKIFFNEVTQINKIIEWLFISSYYEKN